MKVVLGVSALVAVAWGAAPWVAMRRRGTIDQRTLRDMRDEPPRIPGPRRPGDARALGVRAAPEVRDPA